MEPLQMSKPADVTKAEASEAAVTEQQEQQLADEQPSTSRLARKKLERSLKATKATCQKSSREESVFKKPLAPAPRSKRPRGTNEMKNLIITLVNETISQQENDADTTLRRSKRGQVPLRNDWVHTVSDPLQFSFVRGQMYDQCIARAKQRRQEQREHSTMNTMMARKPLCSSTPRSTEPPPTGSKHTAKSSKRKRSPQQQMGAELQFSGLGDTDTCDGIAPLNDITERDEELAVKDAPKKSDRNKKSQKGKQVEQPESEPHPAQKQQKSEKKRGIKKPQQLLVEERPDAPQPEEELVPKAPPSPTLSMTVNEHHQSTAANRWTQLMGWLRGDSDVLPNQTASFNDAQLQSMRILSASNLIFIKIEDIDYAFYDTEEKATSGYMRFKPLQQRKAKRAKSSNLYFIVVYGEFAIDSSASVTNAMECSILYTGDMAEIKKRTRYTIQNRLDEVSVLMIFRK